MQGAQRGQRAKQACKQTEGTPKTPQTRENTRTPTRNYEETMDTKKPHGSPRDLDIPQPVGDAVKSGEGRRGGEFRGIRGTCRKAGFRERQSRQSFEVCTFCPLCLRCLLCVHVHLMLTDIKYSQKKHFILAFDIFCCKASGAFSSQSVVPKVLFNEGTNCCYSCGFTLKMG